MFLASISIMNWKRSKSPPTPTTPDQAITWLRVSSILFSELTDFGSAGYLHN